MRLKARADGAWTLEHSSRVQQVHSVIVQIKEEIKSLARLDGMSQRFLQLLLPPRWFNVNIYIQIINVARCQGNLSGVSC